MMIQNRFGDMILTGRRIGMSPLPGIIIVHTGLSVWEERTVIRHEMIHQEQMKRYLYLGWYILYLYQFLRYGYREMPLEKEARDKEEEA